MKYRTFGNLDWKPSALGFGTMRLPVIGNDPSKIDEARAIGMIRTAVDNGVNYIDTAYPYHGGMSEVVVGKALKNGYLSKVKLATKMPMWLLKGPLDMDRYFEEQLKRLDIDSIDFYLLHSLGKSTFPLVKEYEVIKWAEKKLEEGLIKYLGFSFHDELPLFKQIVDSYDSWTFCQIQYNYMDTDYQAGLEGMRYASQKGIGVIVMEPLKGGQLAKDPPPGPVEKLWDLSAVKRTPAQRAFQWLWNQSEVSFVLSGMSTEEQVYQNLKFANEAETGILKDDELSLYERVKETFERLTPVGCTGCEYCLPCPEGVAIPFIIKLYNEAAVYEISSSSRRSYRILEAEKRADRCVSCGECEKKCPQNIEISSWMKKADALFSS